MTAFRVGLDIVYYNACWIVNYLLLMMLGVVMQKMPDKSDDMIYSLDPIVSSPVRSLLSSLNKHTKPSVRGKKRRASSRTVNSREANDNVPVDSNYKSSDSFSTTNWVEVVFLQTENVNNDLYNVQGGREDTVGVTIVPEWTPPSPPITNIKGQVEASSPKRLLPTSFIKYIQSDSQDDYSDSSDEDTGDDISDIVEKRSTIIENGPEKSVLSILLSAQSPLATTNIKSLLTPDKLCTVPTFVRKQIIQYLPQCDRDSVLLDDHKAIESTLNNEYINAALREWQDNLALGVTYNDKTIPPKTDHTPLWKDNEKYSRRNCVSLNHTGQFDSVLSDNQQCIYDSLFCEVIDPSPQATPIPLATPIPQATPIQIPQPTLNKSLNIHLPRQHYNAAHYTRKQILDEHSYCKPHSSNCSRLPITLKTRCTCLNAPLKVCTLCHKFYHGNCSQGNICQYCVRRKAFDKL